MTDHLTENARLRAALEHIIALNVREAKDRYGNESRAESMACVVVARAALATPAPEAPETFQSRVSPWMQACFGAEISADRLERGDRLLEEVLELLQSGDYPAERVAALTAYVWSRPVGEPFQEVGGVMVTLAAYCLAHDIDLHGAAETELARVWTKVEKIRAKQAEKPTGSALPQAWSAPAPDAVQEAARTRLLEKALKVAMGYLAPQQPGDSRAVDDWFVACAAVQAELDDTDGRIEQCLDAALRAIAESEASHE